MDLHIRLSDETESRLRDLAAAAGQDVSQFVEETLKERIAANDETDWAISAEAWLRKLDEWMATHGEVVGPIDDSRESIYGDRGL